MAEDVAQRAVVWFWLACALFGWLYGAATVTVVAFPFIGFPLAMVAGVVAYHLPGLYRATR